MTTRPVRSPDSLAYHARSRPDVTAVIDLGTRRRFNYEQLNERAERLATGLSHHFGVTAGDRVAIYSQNNSNTFEVQFACWKLGAAYVPFNWRLAIPELEFIARHCTPRVLFHEADIVRHCVANLAKYKVPKTVDFVDELPHNANGKILKRELRAPIASPATQ